MFRLLALTVSATALSLALAAPSLGAPSDSTIALAQDLLVDGRPDLACAMLGAEGEPAAAQVEAIVLLGLCNEELGSIETAIGYYERALRAAPDAQLLRTRLAALYALEGRMAQAEAALTTAMAATLATPPTDPETGFVGAAAGATDPDVPVASASASPSARLSVERFFDSNVNAGSSSTTMTGIFAGLPLPMIIDPGSRAMADSGTRLALQGSHLHPLGPNHALILGAQLGATIHDDLTRYDRQSLGLSTGLIYADPLLTLVVAPSVQVGFEGGALDTVRGTLSASVERQLGEGVSMLAAAGLGHRHNAENTKRSAWDGVLSLGLGYEVSETLKVSIGYAVRPTVSGRPTESFLAHGPELGVLARLTDDIALGLSYGYEHAVYDETSSLFPVDRAEHRHRLAAELNVDLSDHIAKGIGAAARYEFSTTDATLPLYDNARHVASVGLTYSF
jgi:opacity protein-like surface antigen